ncbi:MAG: hypothetical protein LDL07_09180 [Desulfarculus sp.]|nr:hypothetical protein [Desulfarculus sp.]
MPCRWLIALLLVTGLTAPLATVAAPVPGGAGEVQPSSRTTALPSHPCLLLEKPDLERLGQAVNLQAWQWRILHNWALAPARREQAPGDGPGLALVAYLIRAANPDQARSLGRLAAGCAQRMARGGRVQEVTANTLRDPQPSLQAGSLALPPGYDLVGHPDGGSWRLHRMGAQVLTIEPGGPPLTSVFRPGDAYLLLTGDLDLAEQWVNDVALTLDWAWDHFTPDERQSLAAWLVAQARVFADRPVSGLDTASVQITHLTALAGLAARGLHPQAEALVQRARVELWEGRLLPCLVNLGAGGAWFEGANAGSRAGLGLVQTLALFQSALSQNYWNAAPWLKDRLTYLTQAQLPGAQLSPRGWYRQLDPDGDQILDSQDASDYHRMQMLTLLRHRPQDPAAGYAWVMVLDRQAPRVLNDQRLYHEMLAFNFNPPLTPLTMAPLQYLAPAAGRAFSRSDWSERATWLSFHAGPHFALPQHLDPLGLVIHRRGLLLPPGGAYDGPTTSHAQNYAVRSLAHNTIAIFDPQEYSWYDLREGPQRKGMYANDGGARAFAKFDQQGNPTRQAPWTASGYSTGPAAWTALQDLYQLATIEAMAAMPRFTYLRGNATPAYDGSTAKAARVVRHLFHLRAGGSDDAEAAEVIALVDDVELNQTRAAVRLVLHSAERPEIKGEMTSLGQGRWRGRSQALRIDNRASRLDVLCLLPDQAVLGLFGEPGADSWVGDRNWPPRPPAVNQAPWRMELEADSPQGPRRTMVTALLPADSDAPPPPGVAPLASPDPLVVGLVVMDPAWPRVVAVRLGPPSVSAVVSYRFPPGNTRHLVAGLAPGQAYHLEVRDGLATLKPGQGPGPVLTSSPAGSLAFLLPVPGGDRGTAQRP